MDAATRCDRRSPSHWEPSPSAGVVDRIYDVSIRSQVTHVASEHRRPLPRLGLDGLDFDLQRVDPSEASAGPTFLWRVAKVRTPADFVYPERRPVPSSHYAINEPVAVAAPVCEAECHLHLPVWLRGEEVPCLVERAEPHELTVQGKLRTGGSRTDRLRHSQNRLQQRALARAVRPNDHGQGPKVDSCLGDRLEVLELDSSQLIGVSERVSHGATGSFAAR